MITVLLTNSDMVKWRSSKPRRYLCDVLGNNFRLVSVDGSYLATALPSRVARAIALGLPLTVVTLNPDGSYTE